MANTQSTIIARKIIEGIQACEEYLASRGLKYKEQTHFVIQCLHFILNNKVFDDQFYRQIRDQSATPSTPACTYDDGKTTRKPTATNTLLAASSHHPLSLIKGIPIGQFLHIRRNCTDEKTFEIQAKELSSRNNLDILLADSELQELVGPYPKLTAKRAPSLKDKLTRSHFVGTKQTQATTWLGKKASGSWICWNCKACKFVKRCYHFKHLKRKQKNFPIYSYINCNDSSDLCYRMYMSFNVCGKN
ncbi:hypothetical protein XELAEV_18004055mg [Xenopus laevis]|uniref:Uncharacterized protein n=1 Tax=Xenopus laevis TaxID=8355 RepID=A0A974H073_XENLA|nr:hypothetical protein XELAEV_18004055mg [Xenopus laevis]